MAIFQVATLNDARDIGKLRQKIWSSTYDGIYSNDMIDNFDFQWHLEKDIAKIQNPNFNVYLIVENNTNIGYVIFSKEDPPVYKDFSICLNSLYILPEYQRKGIGSKAFNIINDYCRINHINKFYNQCNLHNTKALDFYERMGGIIGHENICNNEKIEDTLWFEYFL